VIVQTFDDATALARALATRVCAAIAATPRLVLGLPTGRTPLPFYEQLRIRSTEQCADWSQVRTFNLDEFVGPAPGEPGSYRAYMQRELFDHVNLAPDHIEFLRGDAPDLEAECARYEQALADAGGLDLIILGIGTNGHIGFNEPGASLEARTHRARLMPTTRHSNRALFGDRPDQVPTEALSMGMATILQAREAVLIATGAGKAPAVARMLAGPITTELPASFLQLHPHATVMVDVLAGAGGAG
jgi:glucosamine-6-phosphate deaminase